MKMSPIKKIVIGLAAITVALSLITANNMASVMLIVASRQAGSANQQSVQANNAVVQNPQTNTNNSQGGSSNDTAVNNTVTDNTATDNTATDNTATTDAATNNNASSNDNGASNNTSTDKPAADDKGSADKGSSKKPESKAEIVEYFNKASNKVKSNAKSVTKVQEENYQAQPMNLGALGAFQGLVSGLIDSNMGVNEEQSGRTGTTAADKNAIYPVENESWASKLTADDVDTATCTEKNGVYTITLTIKEDPLAAEYAHGTGHHGKAFNIVMPQTIKDNAGGASALLGSLKVGYQSGKIIVTVDAATGNITSAKYDFVWLLNINMFGGITAYFGIRTDYDVKW